jgi:hypothetical protein
MVRKGAINAHEYDDVPDGHGGHHDVNERYVVVLFSLL